MEPRQYRIEVEGELGPSYEAAFDTMRVEAADGNTLIWGLVKDQAELHGVLDVIAALGLDLVSLTSTKAVPSQPSQPIG